MAPLGSAELRSFLMCFPAVLSVLGQRRTPEGAVLWGLAHMLQPLWCPGEGPWREKRGPGPTACQGRV